MNNTGGSTVHPPHWGPIGRFLSLVDRLVAHHWLTDQSAGPTDDSSSHWFIPLSLSHGPSVTKYQDCPGEHQAGDKYVGKANRGAKCQRQTTADETLQWCQ